LNLFNRISTVCAWYAQEDIALIEATPVGEDDANFGEEFEGQVSAVLTLAKPAQYETCAAICASIDAEFQ
jgi:hypothetical protein